MHDEPVIASQNSASMPLSRRLAKPLKLDCPKDMAVSASSNLTGLRGIRVEDSLLKGVLSDISYIAWRYAQLSNIDHGFGVNKATCTAQQVHMETIHEIISKGVQVYRAWIERCLARSALFQIVGDVTRQNNMKIHLFESNQRVLTDHKRYVLVITYIGW